MNAAFQNEPIPVATQLKNRGIPTTPTDPTTTPLTLAAIKEWTGVEDVTEVGLGAIPAAASPGHPSNELHSVVVFDAHLMRPRIFQCADICDAFTLETVSKMPGVVHAELLQDLKDSRSVQRHSAITPGASPMISRCTPADLNTITSIDRSNWGHWANPVPLYRQLMDMFPSAIHVARDVCGNVLGFAVGIICENKEEGWVLSVDTSPAARGHGVGKALVSALMDTFRKFGCTTGTAIISPSNLASIRLFEQAGFTGSEVLKGYFSAERSEIRYRCTIA